MKRSVVLVSVVILVWAVFPSAPLQAAEADEKAAILAAGSWLALIDRGRYDDSWDEAAGLFKTALTKKQWATGLKAARAPLGRLVTREVVSAEYAESLPGAPDGKYVVIRYRSVFEHKKAAIETVTPLLDPDGVWRVSGYYIR